MSSLCNYCSILFLSLEYILSIHKKAELPVKWDAISWSPSLWMKSLHGMTDLWQEKLSASYDVCTMKNSQSVSQNALLLLRQRAVVSQISQLEETLGSRITHFPHTLLPASLLPPVALALYIHYHPSIFSCYSFYTFYLVAFLKMIFSFFLWASGLCLHLWKSWLLLNWPHWLWSSMIHSLYPEE